MTASLVIAVRYHEGRYHGEADGFDGVAGWPPAPGRLFQALVAAAARGATLLTEDQRILRWLEALGPPRIAAPPVRPARAVKLFVPNNDLDAKGGHPRRVAEIRVGKHWRPCFFNPEVPLLYVWNCDSADVDQERLGQIVKRLYQLGRGIDVAWAQAEIVPCDRATAMLESHPGVLRNPGGGGEVPCPRQGTLASLVERHQRTRQRFEWEGEGKTAVQVFAQPPKASFRHIGYAAPPRRLHFELRDGSAFAPRPLRLSAPLVTGLRNAAAKRLDDALTAADMPTANAVDRLITGRGAGPDDIAQRIRIMPIPSIGAEHTDPSIRRLLVEVPVDCPLRVDDLQWAFTGIEPYDPATGEAWPGRLVSTNQTKMADRYLRPARAFSSITPVALSKTRSWQFANRRDGGARSQRDAQVSGEVMQALRHAGQRLQPMAIRVQREPFQRRGARAEQFAPGSRFPAQALWHVELRFAETVQGPLVIGDGRFCGLGVMVPTTDFRDVWAYPLPDDVAVVDRKALLHALRRALMSLARDETGRVDRLFSGHEADGSPDRAAFHGHVFLLADAGSGRRDSIGRLVVAAPWAVAKGARSGRVLREQFERVVLRLRDLKAGRAGKFAGLRAVPLEEGDPLIGPSVLWQSETEYVTTRNWKKNEDPVTLVRTDVLAELHRRGLPRACGIEVLDVRVGPRGGRPSAKLEIRFAKAVTGPVLLGRDSHRGGGMFRAVVADERESC